MRSPRQLRLLYLLWVVSAPGGAQTVNVKPLQVFDLSAAVRTRTGREDFTIRHAAQNGARWFTVVSFQPSGDSMIVSGSPESGVQFSDYIHTPADRVAVDSKGLVHVRRRGSTRGETEIQIMSPNLKPVLVQALGGTNLEPVTSGSDLFWRGGTTMFAAYPSAARLEARYAGSSPIDNKTEPYLFFGLQPDMGPRQWMLLGDFSETITLVDQDGALLATSAAPLDEAYRAAGLLPVPAHSDRGSEITRIGWAAVSHSYLYVCLSSRPVSLPAYIAVIEPLKGRLVRVLAAELPTVPRRVSSDNPKGFIYPIAGAVDERLVVVDGGAGLLAVYPIE